LRIAAGRAVAFDLDMTLVDTRPGIRAALLAFAAAHELTAAGAAYVGASLYDLLDVMLTVG
jgi:phosphoglycolate phosphatase-like HAD superfamily hydrolase